MADSPTANSSGPVGVTIKVGGSDLADELLVTCIEVENEVGQVPRARVVIDSGSINENDFEDADGDTFVVGGEISIAAHYGSGDDQDLFSGIITGIRMKLNSDGPVFELVCRDKAAALLNVRKAAHYEQKSDSDIMTQVIEDAGLTADVTATADTARDQLRPDCTDWSYLNAIADRSGFVVTVADGTVTCAPPDDSASAVLTVSLGVDIVAFDAEIDTTERIATARFRGWDDTAQEVVEGASAPASDLAWGSTSASDMDAVLSNRELVLSNAGPTAEADLKVVADARVLRSGYAGLRGMCRFQGSGAVGPGDVIEVTGVGTRFGGSGFVAGVRQTIECGSWLTEVSLGVPNDWICEDARFGALPNAGFNPPVRGLQIGTVVQIDQDPDEKLRVKLKLPMMADPPPEVWARMAVPYATNAGGIQFLPEVGDEMVVGFFTADPATPVIIGALHNGVNARAYDATAENEIKSITTKGQLKVEFDDSKMVITVSTPGGHTLTMDDDATSVTVEDSSGNKLEMTDSGMSLMSPGDISISADGKVDISATGDASVAGNNVTVEGQMGVTAKGGSTGEFSSGGQTTVKGSMVMIN